jgi:periplasmic copper chaperone A
VRLALQNNKKMTFSKTIFAFVSLAFLSAAHAHDYTAAKLKVNHPWARATVAAQSVGGGFMSIANQGSSDDALIAVKWADSQTLELHTHSVTNGVMQMRQVDKIVLPAGKTVTLAPGGFHVMFMMLKSPLAVGEKRDAVLVFEKAGELKVQFKVEPLDYKPAGANAGGAHAH